MKRKVGLIFWFVMLFLVLVSCIGDASAQLDGTAWRLVTYGGKYVIPGSSPTLFFENGSVGGNASCNNFGGNYQARGSQLIIGETAWTLMACADNQLMEQENAYMQLLDQTDRFEFINGQLVITTAAGEKLIFDRIE
ncbi:MAG: META domain-containing protein [Anaerolineales bacterium]|nr:META domain-containing protein [Anaerolineales bacterium]